MDTSVKVPLNERYTIDGADFRAANLFYNMVTNFYDLRQTVALDAFARDGSLTVCNYYKEVMALDVWEYQDLSEQLKQYGPRNIVIGDSFRTVVDHTEKYGFIVVDTPQGLYEGGGMVTAEHFDFLPLMADIMEDRCIVVVYVNSQPYNKDEIGSYGREEYEQYDFDKWALEREGFYGITKGQEVTPEIATHTYRNVFKQMGYEIESMILGPCYSFAPGLPRSFRLALELVRTK